MSKKKKYRLRLKTLDFISPVDRPAQETANVRLLKRAGTLSELVAEKGLFAEYAKHSDELGLVFCWAFTSKIDGADYYDLQGDTISEEEIIKVAAEFMENSRAVDEMHDGEAAGTTIFAMPWGAEVAKAFLNIETDTAGLMVAIKPPPAVFDKFKAGEYTGVSIGGTGIREEVIEDRAPVDDDGKRAFSKRGRLTSSDDGHAHLVDDEVGAFGAGHSSWEEGSGGHGHSHPYTIDDGGTIAIGDAQGHGHTIGAVAARAPKPDDPAAKAADDPTQETETMDALKKAQLYGKLNDAEKAHYAGLDESDQEGYLEMSKAARQAAIAKAVEDDPVVYKSTRTGKEYRASVGIDTIDAIKSADESNAALAVERAARVDAEVAKRAATLNHLPGKVVEKKTTAADGSEVVVKTDTKIALVKAIDAIEDPEVREGAREILAAANKALDPAFASTGLRPATPAAGSAYAKLKGMAATRAVEKSITEAEAFIIICDENKALYDEHRAESDRPRA